MSTIAIGDSFRLLFIDSDLVGENAYLAVVNGQLAIDRTSPPRDNSLFQCFYSCYPTTSVLTYSDQVGNQYPIQLRIVNQDIYLYKTVSDNYGFTNACGNCTVSDPNTFRIISEYCGLSTCAFIGQPVLRNDIIQIADTASGNVIVTNMYGIISSCTPQGSCGLPGASSAIKIEFVSTGAILPIPPVVTPVTNTGPVIVVNCNNKRHQKRVNCKSNCCKICKQ